MLGLGAIDWRDLDECGGNGHVVKQGTLNGSQIRLFEEPTLLETGGGLRNIRKWIGSDSVLVHNGDIYSTMDLRALINAHQQSGLPVTLGLRSDGVAKHIALDETGERVIDIRNKLGKAEGSHVFSGVYCINAELFDYLPEEEIVSVIPAFLRLAELGKLGAVLLDEGHWFDLGERESYLAAHQLSGIGPMIHPEAKIATGAIVENSAVGPGAIIEAGAIVRNSVVWPHARIGADTVLDRCIVYSSNTATGLHQNADL
jgi:NDP-sugar pyrophosphorylase family protein